MKSIFWVVPFFALFSSGCETQKTQGFLNAQTTELKTEVLEKAEITKPKFPAGLKKGLNCAHGLVVGAGTAAILALIGGNFAGVDKMEEKLDSWPVLGAAAITGILGCASELFLGQPNQ